MKGYRNYCIAASIIHLIFWLTVTIQTASSNCLVSEYYCNTRHCIPLDKFCNGADDCGDKSDEPPYCTPCNRTYYGEIGRTYELEVRRPREDRLPFLCYLNFTAAGGIFGDLIQITFDPFTVGKFVSYVVDGCPDGYMSIREKDLPSTGGQWCGSAWGYTVYFSESSSVNLTLLLSRLSDQGIGYTFDFKISFKFLRHMDARLRYGNASSVSYRGNLIASTYCDRILDQCDRRACRIQSPNFPGIYPRNITCYYRVEASQRPDKHPLIAVNQRYAHKIHIKDQIVKYDRGHRQLRVWDQCNIVQDYLTIYDGPSTEDQVLVKLCGGDALPDIISSGSHMLLEFHTSPYDNPFHPAPLSYLPGFELDVKVSYVDTKTTAYVHDKNRCEFFIRSLDSGKNWGFLENPIHSLPPNSTCRYHFQGKTNQIIWLTFLKYNAINRGDKKEFKIATECYARMRILDGPAVSRNGKSVNTTVLGDFCGEDKPRTCDHALPSSSGQVRPCDKSESYISTSSTITLETFLRRGSVLYPLLFRVRYEFVDAEETDPHLCSALYTSTGAATSGRVQSPRNVFYYGRGGNAVLRCGYTFQPKQREKVQLKIVDVGFGNRSCFTEIDPQTGRSKCVFNKHHSESRAELCISEYPWPGIRIPRHCICSKLNRSLTFQALIASTVEVNFIASNMNAKEDHKDIFFEAEYHFLDAMSQSDSDICANLKYERRIKSTSGEISNKDKQSLLSKCGNCPWLIEPEDESISFLYVKSKGYEISKHSKQCPTADRIIIYTGTERKNPKIICPSSTTSNTNQMVELFSEGWNTNSTVNDNFSKSVIVEFVGTGTDTYMTSWLEVSKKPLLSSDLVSYTASVINDCLYRCPELNACISSTLWCDGVPHCPSGYDESDSNCLPWNVPVSYIYAGAGVLVLLTVLILCTSWCKYRQQHDAEKDTGSTMNGDIFAKRYTANGSDLYLDRKDSVC